MKRIAIFLCTFIVFLSIMFLSLYGIDRFYDSKINGVYYDAIGNIYDSTEKDQGLELQRKSVQKDDNLLIFGSSELGAILPPFYPVDFFQNKKSGFQVNLIGRGHTQSIVHAMNFGALGNNIKNKKVVFIISPQWFNSKGLEPVDFNMNFSELQFYSFMFNKDIDKSLKLRLTERMDYLLTEGQNVGHIKTYCYLYSKNNIFTNTVFYALQPYYKFKYYILSIKDKMRTYDVLKQYKNYTNVSPGSQKDFNWDEEKQKAGEAGKLASNSNQFGIENGYYNTYIKDKIETLKGGYKDQSYLKSPEYEDLKFLLDLCKAQNIKPLFISVPVHGKWYDYEEFDKNDRTEYYKKVKDLISSYNFEIADFSKYEYEDYFLKDIMHLGWKGWVYVDEAVNKYYNQN